MTLTQLPIDTLPASSPARWTPEERRDAIVDGLESLIPAVVVAYGLRDWEHFGFDSWDAYVEAVLGGLRLPKGRRSEVAAHLRHDGLSNRAIAAVVGASEATVRRDLDRLDGSSASYVAPEKVTGIDGRSYSAKNPPRPGAGIVIDVESVETTPRPEVAEVVEVVEPLPALPPAIDVESREVEPVEPVEVVDLRGTTFGSDPDTVADSVAYWERLCAFGETLRESVDYAHRFEDLPSEWNEAAYPGARGFALIEAGNLLRREGRRLTKLAHTARRPEAVE